MAAQKNPVSCSNFNPQFGQFSLVLLKPNKLKAEKGYTLPLRQRGHLQASMLGNNNGAF
jgi:hypothetical protein